MPIYFDWTYLIVLPALLLSLLASARVNSVFKKYSKTTTASGMTGAEAARMVLIANGLTHISVQPIGGNLTDHYDPAGNVICLSESVYASRSTAAVGVACHEAGHAVQHAEHYAPASLRQAIVPLTNIGSKLGIWLFIAGLFLAYLSEQLLAVAYIGVLLFSLTAVFQLVTLPTEFDASHRALKALAASGKFTEDEQKQAKKVLSAAAMTYVAALVTALLQVLRLLVILGGRRRK